MRLSVAHLRRHPRVFKQMTGLTVAEFEELAHDLLPRFTAREQQRLSRPDRQRAIGGGTPFTLKPREQFLLTVIWLRLYPMHAVLGFLFGVTHSTVGRVIGRILPLLEAAGRDTMRLPDPGKKHRRTLDALLVDTPELAVIIDTFEQPVQRPKARAEADTYYRGKKKQHTHKTQLAVDETTGRIVDVSATVCGPTADLALLKQSGLLQRLPVGVGSLGDLAYVGMAGLHPQGLGATPRRKPRGRPRPPEDIAYNQAFARRRIKVEHTIGRMRCFQAVAQRDRHHRQHTGRVCAVAGLVNCCLGRKRR
jgi:hypothetical protein